MMTKEHYAQLCQKLRSQPEANPLHQPLEQALEEIALLHQRWGSACTETYFEYVPEDAQLHSVPSRSP